MLITVHFLWKRCVLKEKFICDISNIGHSGNGNIEIVFNESKFEEVKRLIKLSYDNV